MSRPIRWLHLSDVHLGQRGLEVWHQVQSEFRKSLRDELRDVGAPDLILFTGDFAFSGKPTEYSLVDQLLGQILDDIRSVWKDASPALIPVPGNHDVRWPDANSEDFNRYAVFDIFAQDTEDNAQIRSFNRQLWMEDFPAVVENLFSGYSPWFRVKIEDLKSKPWMQVSTGRIPGDLTVLIDLPGTFPLCVVGLNSAWLQYSSENFKGRLAIPTKQFHAALPSANGANPLEVFNGHRSLLLMHHPPDWQHPSRLQAFYEEIFRPGRFEVCLHGHMHAPASQSISKNAEALLTTFQAPSLCGLERFGTAQEERAFGYAFGQVDAEGVVRVYPFARKAGGAYGFLWDQTFGSQKANPQGVLINPGRNFQTQSTGSKLQNAEYETRIRQNEARDAVARKDIIRGEHEELFSTLEEGIRIFVARGDLRDSYSDIIVSSDDTRLTAQAGIAMRILEKAGDSVRSEYETIRRFNIPHGHIAATTGGNLPFRAIFHAAVVDKGTYEYRYPTEAQIRSVVKHSLSCAAAFGVRGIAFPILGGGTGAKAISPWDSITWIIAEFFDFIWRRGRYESLRELVLCVYKASDIEGDLEQLVTQLRCQKEGRS